MVYETQQASTRVDSLVNLRLICKSQLGGLLSLSILKLHSECSTSQQNFNSLNTYLVHITVQNYYEIHSIHGVARGVLSIHKIHTLLMSLRVGFEVKIQGDMPASIIFGKLVRALELIRT
ncbi:unnamed protein product [Cochlearia groenlandica]